MSLLRFLCCLTLFVFQVTASQLSLLEATMAKMERVAVWSLMSGGGSGRDVFTVRTRAWHAHTHAPVHGRLALAQPVISVAHACMTGCVQQKC